MDYLMRNANFIKGLQDLIAVLPKRDCMVELGSFAGESTACFAETFKKVYAVDLWGSSCDEILCRWHSPLKVNDIEEKFNQLAALHSNILKVKKSTHEAYKDFEDNSLDFVYIDASHAYVDVKTDIKLWLPKIKADSYIGGHDYSKNFPGVISAVKEVFGNNIRVFEDTSWLGRVQDVNSI